MRVQGNWICGEKDGDGCGAESFASRWGCYKCRKPRPYEDLPPELKRRRTLDERIELSRSGFGRSSTSDDLNF